MSALPKPHELVPHAGPMCLLDELISASADSLVAEAVVRPDGLFCGEQGVGAWVGIEYMAQAVAAWAGWQRRGRGEGPAIGFLLGSRLYRCTRAWFQPGERLRISVGCQFMADNGLGQFDCRIELAGERVAEAALTVFEPPNAEDFLSGSRND